VQDSIKQQQVSRFCTHCKRSNHTVDHCWDKFGKPSRFKNPNFNQGQKQNARVNDPDRFKNITCYNCKAKGHVKSACNKPLN
ncbi:MAG TPA: hypothetical protein VKR58_14520, partial [Aquella sp.]|nr:hypothetical protein [Aquella sp.]